MIKRFNIIFYLFLLVYYGSVQSNRAEERFDFPNGFEENKGQFTDMNGNLLDDVLYVSFYKNIYIFITKTGISYLINKPVIGNPISDNSSGYNLWYQVNMKIKDCKINVENIIPSKPSSGTINYFDTHCPDGIYGVKKYREITIKNILNKTDMVWRFDGQELKYDFVVHPGGNPEEIKIKYFGADRITSNHLSTLEIETPLGTIKESKLLCYQNNKENVVQANYLTSQNEVSFNINSYNPNVPLIIDPPLALEWATLFSATDGAHHTTSHLKIDYKGNMYFGGQTHQGTSFPFKQIDSSSFLYKVDSTGSLGSLYIGKFSSTGELLWVTLYQKCYWASGIAIDRENNVYFGSYGRSNVPTQDAGNSSYYLSTPPFVDSVPPVIYPLLGGVLLKFDENGKRKWATYVPLLISDVHIDHSDNLYILGSGDPYNLFFPYKNPGGGAYFSKVGAWRMGLIKFNNQGIVRWSTFTDIGISNPVYQTSLSRPTTRILSDSKDNIFIGCKYQFGDLNLVHLPGAYIESFPGGDPLCLYKFDKKGKRIWSTYFGGINIELLDMAVDNQSNLYLSAYSESSNLPFTDQGNGAYFDSVTNTSDDDILIVKFDSFNALKWCTYWGGSGDESIGFTKNGALVTDASNNLYVATASTSSVNDIGLLTNNPTPCGFNHPQDTFSNILTTYTVQTNTMTGQQDTIGVTTKELGAMLFSKFSPDGKLDWATYYGATKGHYILPTDISSDPSNSCIWMSAVTDGTLSDELHLVDYLYDNNAYFQTAGPDSILNKGISLFLRLCPHDPEVSIYQDSTKCPGDTVALIMEGKWYQSYTWSPDIGININPDTIIYIAPLSAINYKVNVSDTCGLTDSVEVTVAISTDCPEEEQTIFIPNVFAPNGNNNSLFAPMLSQYSVESFKIYNNKGELLGDFKDQKEWNGEINGKPANAGVYIYIIEVKTIQELNTQTQPVTEIIKGNVTLIR